jgi:hypothetical protein
MRKILRFVLYVSFFAAFAANADSIEDICTQVDGDAFMDNCAHKEQAAKTRVDKMGVSERIFVYCARLEGGSYSLIETCMQREQ